MPKAIKAFLTTLIATLLSLFSAFASAGGIADAERTRLVFENYRLHKVATPDGIVLQVIELLGDDGQAMSDAQPELLVHGFSQNVNTWAAIAPLRRQAGKRVFLANWRGHGQGSTRSIGLDGTNPDSDSRMTFDNLALQDVPTLVDFVFTVSGRKKLTWVGHSMGGMMMHVALSGLARDTNGNLELSRKAQSYLRSRLRSFIAIGSPVATPQGGLLERLGYTLTSSVGIRADASHRLELPFGKLVRGLIRDQAYTLGQFSSIGKGLMNLSNVSRKEYDIIRDYSGSDVPRPLSQSVNFGSRKTGYASAEGTIDYQAISMGRAASGEMEPKQPLNGTGVPTLIISADDDLLAPLKEQVEMSTTRGLKQIVLANTGHIDMTFGSAATVIHRELSIFDTPLRQCLEAF